MQTLYFLQTHLKGRNFRENIFSPKTLSRISSIFVKFREMQANDRKKSWYGIEIITLKIT